MLSKLSLQSKMFLLVDKSLPYLIDKYSLTVVNKKVNPPCPSVNEWKYSKDNLLASYLTLNKKPLFLAISYDSIGYLTSFSIGGSPSIFFK